MRPVSPVLIALLACGLTTASRALDSDRDQPVQIESDRAEFSEPDGITTYSGNVHLTQGSIELLADQVELHSQDERIVELVALGQPAYYEQVPAPGEQKLVARGDRIRYLLEDDLIELRGNASLSQQGTTLSGGTILYDVRQHSLRASSEDGATETRDRVRVTLPPLSSGQEKSP